MAEFITYRGREMTPDWPAYLKVTQVAPYRVPRD